MKKTLVLLLALASLLSFVGCAAGYDSVTDTTYGRQSYPRGYNAGYTTDYTTGYNGTYNGTTGYSGTYDGATGYNTYNKARYNTTYGGNGGSRTGTDMTY